MSAPFSAVSKLAPLIAALGCLATAASAQTPVLTSREDIAVCLCLNQSVASRLTTLDARRGEYEAAQQEVARLQAEIDAARPTVDVNNPAAIDAFRARVIQVDQARLRMQDTALPAYQSAVTAYNQRVEEFSQRCAGRAMDPAVEAQVRQSLVCQLQ